MTSINSTDKVTRVSNQQAEQSSSTGELKRSATHKTDEAVSTALNRAAQSTRRAKDGLTNDADKFKVTGDDGKFLAKKGDDVAVVSGNNNLVRLQGGNDIAVLSANADGNRIHGGGGDDTLKIDGKLKDYVFTRAEGGWIEVKNTETGTVNLIRNMDYVVVGDGKPVKTKDLVQGGKPGNEKPENDKPGKPDKEDKPGKPDKEDKPGKPDKEDKPGKPDKEDKPGKPGKDKGPFTKEADEHVFSKGGEKANMRKGDDIAKVNSDDNLIRMNGGDDYTMVALGTSGNELHGGGGKDLIHFQGEREQYSIEKAEKNFYIITDLETGETNRFRNYEQIQFGNGKPMSVEDLDIDGGSGPNPPPKGPFDENDNDYDHVGDGAALDALEGDDYISVTGDNNQIQMNTGDDSNYVIAGSKDNTFDGSDGFDTIVFQGSVKDYTVEQLENGGYKITNNLDGSENYFINYEAVGFDDAEAVSPDQLIGGGGTDSPFTEGDDFLEGTADGETIDTLAGDDELWLSGDDNNVTMNDGDDVTGVYIGSDNNFFDGADGTDTIIFQGEREEYEFTLNEDGTYQVVHTPTGDTNLFVNYEQVSFGDSADTVAPGDLVTETPTGPTDGDDTLDIPTDSGEYDLLGGNDTANVSGDDNAVAMGSGDDMTNVQAGASGNAFDGGDGNDTIAFYDGIENYVVTLGDDGVYTATHQGTGEVNTFQNYETISFGNGEPMTPDEAVAATDPSPYTEGDDTDVIDTDGNAVDMLAGNDQLTLGGSGNNVNMNAGDDVASVAGDKNKVNMGDGDDMTNLNDGAAGNTLVGGDGTDTLILSGNQADYALHKNADGSYTLIDKRDGSINNFSEYEMVKFADNELDLSGGTTGPSDLVDSDGNVITGTPGDDTYTVSGNDNTIYAIGGDDSITVSGGNNSFYLDGGNDTITIELGAANNTIYGGAGGNDTVVVPGNIDDYEFIQNEDGSVTMVHKETGDTNTLFDIENIQYVDVSGSTVVIEIITIINNGGGNGSGNNTFVVEGPNEHFFGTGNNDTGSVTGNSNWVNVGAGDDTVSVEGDANTIGGGSGDDVLSVSGDNNVIHAQSGADMVTLTEDASGNFINGGSDVDTLHLPKPIENYTVEALADGTFKITDNETGLSNTFVNIETFQFGTDAPLSFDSMIEQIGGEGEDVTEVPETDGNESPEVPETDGNESPEVPETDGNESPQVPDTDGNDSPDTDGNDKPDASGTVGTEEGTTDKPAE